MRHSLVSMSAVLILLCGNVSFAVSINEPGRVNQTAKTTPISTISESDYDDWFKSAENRNIETIKILMSKGIDINRKNTSGRTALVEVAVRGHTNILRILLLRETEKIIGLLNIYKNKQKMNNDDLGPYLIQDHSVNIDDEALIEAASNGLTEVVRMLLNRGADTNCRDHGHGGQTALICAAKRGHTKTVRLLLDRGVDISFQDYRGQTALDYISAIKQTL